MNDHGTIRWIGALAVAAAAGTATVVAVRAQEEDGRSPPATSAPQGVDYGSLVRDLGDPDFSVREKAYARLREAGEDARAAVEEGTRSEDPQIRWSTARLLRLLDGDRGEKGSALRFGGRDRRDGPRGPDLTWPDFPGLDREEFARSMEGLRRRMEELERRLRDFGDPFEEPFATDSPESTRVERHVVVDRRGERVEVDIDADGRVKVRLSRRGADGSPGETEEFEAESLEALAKEHPGIHREVKDLVGRSFEVRIGRLAPERIFDFLRRGERPLPGIPGRRPRLGVRVSEVPAVLRAHLPVPEQEGLVVEEVLEGEETPARRLGLRRHDILLSLNGIPVSTPEEVGEALAAVGEGEEIRVRLLREGTVTERATNR